MHRIAIKINWNINLLKQEGFELFGDKMLAFRTELEVLSEYFHSEN